MKETYRTIKDSTQEEITIKKSRFIANVLPVETEQEAIDFIENIRTKYWDATHNVYAYSISDNNISRCSDDGEPSQTAGVPILNVIKGHELTNIAVVVTRYFGGTLLGTGGLVKAYSTSARLAIDKAQIIKKVLCNEVSLIVEYTLLGKVMTYINNSNYKLKDIQYLDNVVVNLYIPTFNIEEFDKNIQDISAGNININTNNALYTEIKDNTR